MYRNFDDLQGCAFNHYENIARDQDGGFLYELESALLDLRFKIRGQEKPATKVGILAIDEKRFSSLAGGLFPDAIISKH